VTRPCAGSGSEGIVAVSGGGRDKTMDGNKFLDRFDDFFRDGGGWGGSDSKIVEEGESAGDWGDPNYKDESSGGLSKGGKAGSKRAASAGDKVHGRNEAGAAGGGKGR
jgi:hypothetical protein